MKVTEVTRNRLKWEREIRDMGKAGWEHVGERGGRLWELHRGFRYKMRIVDVKIDCHGMGLWVKIA